MKQPYNAAESYYCAVRRGDITTAQMLIDTAIPPGLMMWMARLPQEAAMETVKTFGRIGSQWDWNFSRDLTLADVLRFGRMRCIGGTYITMAMVRHGEYVHIQPAHNQSMVVSQLMADSIIPNTERTREEIYWGSPLGMIPLFERFKLMDFYLRRMAVDADKKQTAERRGFVEGGLEIGLMDEFERVKLDHGLTIHQANTLATCAGLSANEFGRSAKALARRWEECIYHIIRAGVWDDHGGMMAYDDRVAFVRRNA